MFKNLFIKIKEIYLKFPVEISLILIYSIYLILRNHRDSFSSQGEEHIFKFVCYTFFLLVGFKYLFTSKVKYICSALCVSLIFLFLSGTRGLKTDLSEINQVRTALFGLLSFSLMIVIPFIKSRRDEKIDNYNLFLFKNLSLTMIISNILFLGLSGILALIFYLLIGENSKVYFDIMIFSYLIFPVFFMLSFYPDNMDNIEKDNTKIIKFLLLFIFIPLLGIYTLVVYSYFLKILIKMSIPKGEVSLLILIHGIATIIVLLLIRGSSLIDESVKKKIGKIFSITELPLIFLLFIAVFQRINQYGMTINRYSVVIFGVYLLLMVLYILISKRNKTFVIMSIFIAVLFFSTVGPGNIFKIPFYLQEKRLEKILKKHNIDKNGKSDKVIDEKIKRDIASIFSYFKDWDNKALEKKYNYDVFSENLQLEKFDRPYGSDNYGIEQNSYYVFLYEELIDVKDYDVLFNNFSMMKNIQYKDYKFNNTGNELTVYRNETKILDIKMSDINNDILKLIKNGEVSDNIELIRKNGEIVDKKTVTKDFFEKEYSTLTVKYNFENNDLKMSVLVSNANFSEDRGINVEFRTVLVKFKQ